MTSALARARSPVCVFSSAALALLLTAAAQGCAAEQRVDDERGTSAPVIVSAPAPAPGAVSAPGPSSAPASSSAPAAPQSQSMPVGGEWVRGAEQGGGGVAAGHASGGSSGTGAGVWATIGTKPLLGIACGDDPAFYAIARGLNAARCYVLYEHFIVFKGQIDEPKFRKYIQEVVPERWDGLACLDIELEWPEALRGDPESAEYKHAAASLLRVLAVAREVRPETKWSFYGIPQVPFWVKNAKGATSGWDQVSPASKDEMERKAKQMQVIVDACDWIAPTIYDAYLDSATPSMIEAQKARVRELVTLSREMGAKSGKPKPVLPFIWHRIHQSNKENGLVVLSAAEFISGQIEPSLSSGAAGVVWWGSDASMYHSGEIGKLQPQEVKGVEKDPKAAIARFTASRIQLLKAIASLFPK